MKKLLSLFLILTLLALPMGCSVSRIDKEGQVYEMNFFENYESFELALKDYNTCITTQSFSSKEAKTEIEEKIDALNEKCKAIIDMEVPSQYKESHEKYSESCGNIIKSNQSYLNALKETDDVKQFLLIKEAGNYFEDAINLLYGAEDENEQ